MTAPARVVNRALTASTVIVLLVGAAVAVWGDHASAPATDGTDSTDVVVPTTEPGLTGARPASTQGSWFYTDGAAQQYDYPMDRLSCAELQRYLTTDLCAVAFTTRGSMMLVGTEGYWDPNEPDDDGVVRIPLYFQVFTHTLVDGPPRAASVLDGELYVEYITNESEADSVTLSRARVAGDDVLVVRYRALMGSTPVEHVQVVAMNENGAPSLAAAYQGDNVRVASTESVMYIAADRYGPPSDGKCCDKYSTVWTLSPRASDHAWFAVEESRSDATTLFDKATLPTTVSSYDFPQKYGSSTPT